MGHWDIAVADLIWLAMSSSFPSTFLSRFSASAVSLSTFTSSSSSSCRSKRTPRKNWRISYMLLLTPLQSVRAFSRISKVSPCEKEFSTSSSSEKLCMNSRMTRKSPKSWLGMPQWTGLGLGISFRSSHSRSSRTFFHSLMSSPSSFFSSFLRSFSLALSSSLFLLASSARFFISSLNLAFCSLIRFISASSSAAVCFLPLGAPEEDPLSPLTHPSSVPCFLPCCCCLFFLSSILRLAVCSEDWLPRPLSLLVSSKAGTGPEKICSNVVSAYFARNSSLTVKLFPSLPISTRFLRKRRFFSLV